MWNSLIWCDLLQFLNWLVHYHHVSTGYFEANLLSGLPYLRIAHIPPCWRPRQVHHGRLPVAVIHDCTQSIGDFIWSYRVFSKVHEGPVDQIASTTHQCCILRQCKVSIIMFYVCRFLSIFGHSITVFLITVRYMLPSFSLFSLRTTEVEKANLLTVVNKSRCPLPFVSTLRTVQLWLPVGSPCSCTYVCQQAINALVPAATWCYQPSM